MAGSGGAECPCPQQPGPHAWLAATQLAPSLSPALSLPLFFLLLSQGAAAAVAMSQGWLLCPCGLAWALRCWEQRWAAAGGSGAVEHPQHRGHGSLVVVGAGGAGGVGV